MRKSFNTATLLKAMESLHPLHRADKSWDNVGMIVSPPLADKEDSRTKVLLTIDLTSKVMEEVTPDVGWIVAYHPPIFRGLKSLSDEVPLQNTIMQCIQRQISVYSPHTSMDFSINNFIADSFAPHIAKDTLSHIQPPTSSEMNSKGSGLQGVFEEGTSLERIVFCIKEKLGLKTLMLARSSADSQNVEQFAVCAGSGGSVFSKLRWTDDSRSKLWITGELSHHELLAATSKGIHVIMTCHSNSERPYLKVLRDELDEIINKKYGCENVEVLLSQFDHDPIDFM